MEDYILDFDNMDKASTPKTGGKNANLGELIKAGANVPPGFAVTSDGYLRFLEKAGIREKVFELLAGVDVADTSSLDGTSAKIRELVETAAVSSEVEESIREGYASLCDRCGLENVPVAVRSSATAEDLSTASFAGQQDTYLWIRGANDVVTNVRKCWASLFTPQAIAYRINNKIGHENVLMSVGVQKMVNAKTAGVMFTIDPVNGDPSKVVIEASWGLGETVVAGIVNPDRFVVDKVVLEISDKRVSHKHVEHVFDHDREEVIEVETPSERCDLPCLERKEIMELAKFAKRIEDHYGSPQDIEWAIDRDLPFPDNIFVVQCRPETVWSQRQEQAIMGKKSGYELLMERAMKITKVQS